MAPASEGKPGTTLLIVQVELPAFNLLSQANFNVKANRYEEMHEGAIELLQAFADSYEDCLEGLELQQANAGLERIRKRALSALEELQAQVKLVDEWKYKVDRASSQMNKMRDAYYKELFHLREQVYQKKKADEKGQHFTPNYAIHFDPAEYTMEDEVAKLVNEKADFIKQEYDTKFTELELRSNAKVKTLNNNLITSNMLLARKETLLQKMMGQHGYEDEEHIQEELGKVKISKEKIQSKIDSQVEKAEQKVTYDFRKKLGAKPSEQQPAETQNAQHFRQFLERRFGGLKEARAHLSQSRSLDQSIGLVDFQAIGDELGYACSDPKQTFKELSGGQPFTTLSAILEHGQPSAKFELPGGKPDRGSTRRWSAPGKTGEEPLVAISEADEWDGLDLSGNGLDLFGSSKASKTCDDEDTKSVTSEGLASNSSMESAESSNSKASKTSKSSKGGRSSIGKAFAVANAVKKATNKLKAGVVAPAGRAGVRKATIATMTEVTVNTGTEAAWEDEPGSVSCFTRLRPLDRFRDEGTDARPYEEAFERRPRRTRAVQSQIDGRMLDKAMEFYDKVAEKNWNELADIMTYESEGSQAQRKEDGPGSPESPKSRPSILEAYQRTGKVYELSAQEREHLGRARPNENMTIGDFDKVEQVLTRKPMSPSSRRMTFPMAVAPEEQERLERITEELQDMSAQEVTEHFETEKREVAVAIERFQEQSQLQMGQEQAGGSSSSSSSGRSTPDDRSPRGARSQRSPRSAGSPRSPSSQRSPLSASSRGSRRNSSPRSPRGARSRSRKRAPLYDTSECGIQCCLSTLGTVSIPAEDEEPEAQLEGVQQMLDAAKELRERLPAMRLRAEKLAAEAAPGSEREQKLLEELRKLNTAMDGGRPALKLSATLDAEAKALKGAAQPDAGMSLEGLLSRHGLGEAPKDLPPAAAPPERHTYSERRASAHNDVIVRKDAKHKTTFFRRPGESRQFQAGLVRTSTMHNRDVVSPSEPAPEEADPNDTSCLRRKSAVTARKISAVDTTKIIADRARRGSGEACPHTGEEAKASNEEKDADQEPLNPGWSGLVPPAAFTHRGVHAEVEAPQAAADPVLERSTCGPSRAGGEKEPVKRSDRKLHTTSLCFVGGAKAAIASAAAAAAAAVGEDSDDSEPPSPRMPQVPRRSSEGGRRQSASIAASPAPASPRDSCGPWGKPEAPRRNSEKRDSFAPEAPIQRHRRRISSVRFKETLELPTGGDEHDGEGRDAAGPKEHVPNDCTVKHTNSDGSDRQADADSSMLRISSMGPSKKPARVPSASPDPRDSFLDADIEEVIAPDERGPQAAATSTGPASHQARPANAGSPCPDAHLPELPGIVGSQNTSSSHAHGCTSPVERPCSRNHTVGPNSSNISFPNESGQPLSVLPRAGGAGAAAKTSPSALRARRKVSLPMAMPAAASCASPTSPRQEPASSRSLMSPIPLQVASEKVADVVALARAEATRRPAQSAWQEEQQPVSSPNLERPAFKRNLGRTTTQPASCASPQPDGQPTSSPGEHSSASAQGPADAQSHRERHTTGPRLSMPAQAQRLPAARTLRSPR